jgi:hypothetical protein
MMMMMLSSPSFSPVQQPIVRSAGLESLSSLKCSSSSNQTLESFPFPTTINQYKEEKEKDEEEIVDSSSFLFILNDSDYSDDSYGDDDEVKPIHGCGGILTATGDRIPCTGKNWDDADERCPGCADYDSA